MRCWCSSIKESKANSSNLVVVKTRSFTNIDNEWGVSHISDQTICQKHGKSNQTVKIMIIHLRSLTQEERIEILVNFTQFLRRQGQPAG